MKRGFLFFLIISIGALGISISKKIDPEDKNIAKENAFVKIPIRFIPLINAPYLTASINGCKCSLNIDSGFSDNFCFDRTLLDKIKSKEDSGTVKWFDINGNQYSSSRFRIPKVDIAGKMHIQNPIVSEESLEFISHGAQIFPDLFFIHKTVSSLYRLYVDGRLGFNILRQGICLFNFGDSELIFAKNFDSLIHEAGCSFEGFASAAIEIKDFGAVLSIETDLGYKKMLLDTGSTWSIINRPSAGKKSGLSFSTNKFVIGGVDLGKHRFLIADISDEFSVDGILGVNFFKSHTICLDIPNKTAYIQKNKTASERFMSWLYQN